MGRPCTLRSAALADWTPRAAPGSPPWPGLNMAWRFSRFQPGAKTPLAGLVTALMMLLTLYVLTPYFYFMPLFCLAAVVISSVTSLVRSNSSRAE